MKNTFNTDLQARGTIGRLSKKPAALAAAILAATLSTAAFAQAQPAGPAQQGQSAPQPTVVNGFSVSNGNFTSNQPAAPGVVYPGQGMTSQPASFANVAQPGMTQPGVPGQAIGQTQPGAPAMPPLPGAQAESAAKLAVDDIIPRNIANEILELRRRQDEMERARAIKIGGAPRPISRGIDVTQAPGETPIPVRIGMGVTTNIVFTDATGAPWPVEFATPGSETFSAILPVAGTPTLQLRANSNYAYGGVSVTLKGNHVPINLTISAAQTEVDTRIDARVLKRGPNAVAPIIDRGAILGSPVNPTLQSFLDGVPPEGSRELKTNLSGLRAWSHNGGLFVRTNVTIASPAWLESASSVDGTHVYSLPAVPAVVVSVDGRMQTVSIGD